MNIEKAFTLTAKMLEARDMIRRLDGEKYQANMAPWLDAVSQAAQTLGVSPLDAVVELTRGVDEPSVLLRVIAAGVELTQASNPGVPGVPGVPGGEAA